MAASDMIGAWRLITVEDHQPDGSIIYPYGKEAMGYLKSGAHFGKITIRH